MNVVILSRDANERLADAVLAQAAAALDGRAEWPPEIKEAPAVQRWIAARQSQAVPADPLIVPDNSELMRQYQPGWLSG